MGPALLGLWGPPSEAAAAAARLYDAPTEHADAIRAALRTVAPRPPPGERAAAHPDRALLPWRMTDLPPAARVQLETMGLKELGDARPRTVLARSGREILAIAWAAGLALAAIGAWVRAGEDPQSQPLEPAPLTTPGDSGIPEDAPAADAVPPPDAAADAAEATEELITDPSQCPREEKTLPLSPGGPSMTFVRVCGGSFLMGSDDSDADDDEKPVHRVTVSSFWIGKHEVSNEDYRTKVKDHQVAEEAQWPATSVSWDEARAFCRGLPEDWKGDLPTEAEWEYAARGPKARKYPWGNDAPSSARARYHSSSPVPVTALSDVGSPFGSLHLAGNAWEWVEDCYAKDTYATPGRDGAKNPVVASPVGCDRVLRGGSFFYFPRDLRSAGRGGSAPVNRDFNFGFRCVLGSRRER